LSFPPELHGSALTNCLTRLMEGWDRVLSRRADSSATGARIHDPLNIGGVSGAQRSSLRPSIPSFSSLSFAGYADSRGGQLQRRCPRRSAKADWLLVLHADTTGNACTGWTGPVIATSDDGSEKAGLRSKLQVTDQAGLCGQGGGRLGPTAAADSGLALRRSGAVAARDGLYPVFFPFSASFASVGGIPIRPLMEDVAPLLRRLCAEHLVRP